MENSSTPRGKQTLQQRLDVAGCREHVQDQDLAILGDTIENDVATDGEAAQSRPQIDIARAAEVRVSCEQ